jgi:hypothetical protein
MNEKELKLAWLVVKEIIAERKPPVVHNKKRLEAELAEGIQQLDRGEGTDFGELITELKKKYVKK